MIFITFVSEAIGCFCFASSFFITFPSVVAINLITFPLYFESPSFSFSTAFTIFTGFLFFKVDLTEEVAFGFEFSTFFVLFKLLGVFSDVLLEDIVCCSTSFLTSLFSLFLFLLIFFEDFSECSRELVFPLFVA